MKIVFLFLGGARASTVLCGLWVPSLTAALGEKKKHEEKDHWEVNDSCFLRFYFFFALSLSFALASLSFLEIFFLIFVGGKFFEAAAASA